MKDAVEDRNKATEEEEEEKEEERNRSGGKRRKKEREREREREESVVKTKAHIPGGRPSIPSGWEQLSASICSGYIGATRVVSRKPKENTSSSFFFSGFRRARRWLESSAPFRSYTTYPPSIFHSHSSRPIAGIVHAAAIYLGDTSE